jgi:hypothetical protein
MLIFAISKRNGNIQCCQIYDFSREFTNFHTFLRNLFFYRYGRKTKLKIASHGLFHKKSFVLKTIHFTSSYRKNKRIFVKKAHERLFIALFAVNTGKKKDFVKKCEFFLWIHAKKCEISWIHANSRDREFGSTVLRCEICYEIIILYEFISFCICI